MNRILPSLVFSFMLCAIAHGQGQVVGWGRDSGGQSSPRSVSLVPFRDLAGGAGHTLLLRADGSVLALGLNDLRQCSVPPGLGGVSSVAAGVGHSLALQASGRIVGWGANQYGESRGTGVGGAPILGTPDGSAVRIDGAPVTDAMQIAAGGTYIDDPNGEGDIRGISLAVRSDGSVLAWGCGLDGQTAVPAELVAMRVAAGGEHALAVRSGDGAVLAWGLNDAGQCGGTDAGGAPITGGPGGAQVQLLGQPLSGVREVAAGLVHSLALRDDGTVVAWGSNFDDENGTTTGQATPPGGLSGVTAIAAAGYHSVALRGDGHVTCWGSDLAWGGEFGGQSSPPTGLGGVGKISAGWVHSLALTRDGKAVGWGYSGDGSISLPQRITGIVSLDSGSEHTVGVRADGSVVAWGLSDRGQCLVPPSVAGIQQVACGGWHSVVRAANGRVYAWGSNADFTPAGNIVNQSVVPATLPSAKWVGAGLAHTLAVLTTGQVRAWGMNTSGQCLGTNASGLPITSVATGTVAVRILGSTLSSVAQATGGVSHSIALRTTGTAVAWGFGVDDEATVPAGLSGLTRIAAGYSHNVALRSDGTVTAWGSDLYPLSDMRQSFYSGQTVVPAGLAGVADIAAGQAHSIALRSDGTVVCWGSDQDWLGNPAGQSTPPANLSGVTSIACGDQNSLVVLASTLVDCGTATAPGEVTLKVSGGGWQDVNIWHWNDSGPRIPGALSAVDLGGYGSVGLDCDGRAGALTVRAGAALIVPFDMQAGAPAADALQVSGPATLAGRAWLLATGSGDRLPTDLHVPILSCASTGGTNFGFIQSNLPAPDGTFLTIDTSVVSGRTELAFTLGTLTVDGSLTSTNVRPVSGKVIAATTIDVNDDGLDDLALAIDNGPASPGALQVLLNDPAFPGTLGTSSLFLGLPPTPSCLAVGDVDGDGWSDVVVGISTDDTVRVFNGNAGGTLTPGLVITGVVGSPVSVAVLEALSPVMPGGGSVVVGSSSSKVQTFSSSGTLTQIIAVSGEPTVMSVGNADGVRGRDIATGGTRSSSVNGFASGGETGFVEVLVDDGSGYAVDSSVAIYGVPVGMDMADLDGDGLDDVVTANADPTIPTSGSVTPVLSILRNDAGSFGGAIAYEPSGASAGLAVTLIDVDGDADRDIVSVHVLVGADSAAALLRVDTTGPGEPISIGAETELPAEDPVLAARGELDGAGEEDAYLVDERSGAALTVSRYIRPFVSVAVPVLQAGDLDGNGSVDTADVALLLLDFGPCPGCASDLDDSGEVDTGDLALLLLLFD